jgi:hypothetical protein
VRPSSSEGVPPSSPASSLDVVPPIAVHVFASTPVADLVWSPTPAREDVTLGEGGSGAPVSDGVLPTTSSTRADIANVSSITRAQKGIRQPRVYIDGIVRYGKHGFLTSCGKPHSINDALGNSNWNYAMDLEYDALMKNKTWHLVPPMKGINVVGCKRVCKVKRKQDGSLDRYKAILVAKGFK